MEIKAPKSIKDLRIKHLPALLDERYQNDLTKLPLDEQLDIMLDFVSKLCLVDKTKLMTVDYKDLIKVYNHCADLFNNVDFRAEPPKEIIINKKYYSLVDVDRVSTGWHADFGKSDVDKDPVRVACLMYVPKGANYSELDETGNLKDRIADRYEDFKEHFELITFMQGSGFFLRKCMRLQNGLKAKVKVLKIIEKLKASMIGRRFFKI
jgi:hypothetical protein